MSRFGGVCGSVMIDDILSPTFAGRVDRRRFTELPRALVDAMPAEEAAE
jgi:hypothetical protein